MSKEKKTIAIIGGGAAALSFASFIDSDKYKCTIYEKNSRLGRKFLVAGKGGFNLTHNEDISQFIKRYTPPGFLNECLSSFTNADFRTWLSTIGIETFAGSSHRVYPLDTFKPIDILKMIEANILSNRVEIKCDSEFSGFKNGQVHINNTWIDSDFVVFALGGASWKKTGSTGSWSKIFTDNGIEILPFQASNCSFHINWSEQFIEKNEGLPIKNMASFVGNKIQKGEIVITKKGIEGNGIYALSPEVRKQLSESNSALIHLDLKPNNSVDSILLKLKKSSGNTSNRLRNELKLSVVEIDLLKQIVEKEDFLDDEKLAQKIKSLPLNITGFAPIDEAISTVGGIPTEALSSNFELKNSPNKFCIGEMVDWDAPTGGYLLQACFSMGRQLATHLNSKKD